MKMRCSWIVCLFFQVFFFQNRSWAEPKMVLQECRFDAKWTQKDDSVTHILWSDRLVPELFHGEAGRGFDVLEQTNTTIYSQRLDLDSSGNILSLQVRQQLDRASLSMALLKKGLLKTEVIAKASTSTLFHGDSVTVGQKVLLHLDLENPKISLLKSRDFAGPEAWDLPGFPLKERVFTGIQVQCVFHRLAELGSVSAE